MFNNVGDKIKIVAKILLAINIIAAIFAFILFFILAIDSGEGLFMAFAFFVPPIIFLLGMVSSWFMYAFGDITSNVSQITDNICPKDDLDQDSKNSSFTFKFI